MRLNSVWLSRKLWIIFLHFSRKEKGERKPFASNEERQIQEEFAFGGAWTAEERWQLRA